MYSVPGKTAIAAVTSYADTKVNAELTVNAKSLGFPRGCRVTDVEGGAELPVKDGMISLPLGKHELKLLRFSSKGSQ